MRKHFARVAVLIPVLLSGNLLLAKTPTPSLPQATVIDSGSTNRAALRVSIDSNGHASVEPQNGALQHVNLPASLGKQFMQDLEAAGPLNQLPAAHCMKSISFGSSTYVEFAGHRSPDLSCPGTADPHCQALGKDARAILQAAREAANVPLARHVLTLPAPHRQ